MLQRIWWCSDMDYLSNWYQFKLLLCTPNISISSGVYLENQYWTSDLSCKHSILSPTLRINVTSESINKCTLSLCALTLNMPIFFFPQFHVLCICLVVMLPDEHDHDQGWTLTPTRMPMAGKVTLQPICWAC